MIEERSSYAGEVLRLPPAAKEVSVFGTFTLPATARGRLLLEAPGFFHAHQ